MKKKASLNDVAQKVGVSKTLVSLVLNGRWQEARISEEMYKKVLSAAKKLNYKPNQMARGLRTGISQTIGLLVADISNNFFSQLGRKIEDAAATYQYQVIFCSFDEDPKRFGELIQVLLDKQVDGLIISPGVKCERQIKKLLQQHIPFVLVDRYFSGIPTNSVRIDNAGGAYKAVEHLIQMQYRRIGIINFQPGLEHIKERKRGYEQALLDAGYAVDPALMKWVSFDNVKQEVRKAIDELLSLPQKTEAIFFVNNQVGLIGLEYLIQLKIHVPDDLAVVSFDDPEAYRLCATPITAVTQPIESLAENAVHLLLKHIQDGKLGVENPIVLPTELIVRRSSLPKHHPMHSIPPEV